MYVSDAANLSTHATGVGFSGVTICQPAPTPHVNPWSQPTGFINPQYSLFIIITTTTTTTRHREGMGTRNRAQTARDTLFGTYVHVF